MRREGRKTQSSNAKKLVTIQYRVPVSDGEGGFTITWVDRPNVWAEICPISATQRFEYDSINVSATHRIKILGNLTFQANTKWVNDTWSITWSAITGTDVQLDYNIDGGAYTSISASEPNSGTYDWTIDIGAIGRNVRIRVMSLTDPLSYIITDPYNVVAEGTRDGLPIESDRVKWSLSGVDTIYEILTVENMQERNIQAVLTCKEHR